LRRGKYPPFSGVFDARLFRRGIPAGFVKAEISSHALAAKQMQAELIRRMSPGRRLEIAQGLYRTAWQLKEAGLRRQYPDWSDDEIRAKCRRVFVTGYAGA